MFTEELKKQTEQNHSDAEQTEFMQTLFRGNLPIDSYVKYLTILMYVYDTLEITVRDNLDDDLISMFFDEKLERSWRISADLGNLKKVITFNSKLTDHVNEYMIMIGNASPVELLAHHYIRYLGDISGGQILKRILQQSYGLSEAQMSFYGFDLDIKQYRDNYKAKLNSFIKSANDQQLFINTVNDVYKITTKILNAI